ncbi:MAG: lipoyl(octanoyl) transferase LipB [FCB group bacterium]|nr:lipoyl(octanoyl) transferase LipB [FCB group bacterium]
MKHRFFGWKLFLGRRPYKAALDWQKRMIRYRIDGSIRDTLFFTEHPDVVTIGRDCREEDKSGLENMETHNINRGGGLTYHGPGQLVIYPIIDLSRRGKDLHIYIENLEEGIIRAFDTYGLKCRRIRSQAGVWTDSRKIASIGVAVTRWVTYHGAAVNLTTDMKKFNIIRPCGLNPEIMTSASEELGWKIALEEFADRLTEAYSEIFDTSFEPVDFEELSEIVQMEESTQSL